MSAAQSVAARSRLLPWRPSLRAAAATAARSGLATMYNRMAPSKTRCKRLAEMVPPATTAICGSKTSVDTLRQENVEQFKRTHAELVAVLNAMEQERTCSSPEGNALHKQVESLGALCRANGLWVGAYGGLTLPPSSPAPYKPHPPEAGTSNDAVALEARRLKAQAYDGPKKIRTAAANTVFQANGYAQVRDDAERARRARLNSKWDVRTYEAVGKLRQRQKQRFEGSDLAKDYRAFLARTPGGLDRTRPEREATTSPPGQHAPQTGTTEKLQETDRNKLLREAQAKSSDQRARDRQAQGKQVQAARKELAEFQRTKL